MQTPILTTCKLQFPGIWQQNTSKIIDLHHQIASDLERRKQSLRDANGYMHKIAENLQDGIRRWTDFPEEATLDLGQMGTYVVNCPKMHPLTSLTLVQVFESMGHGLAIKVRLCVSRNRLSARWHLV